MRLLNVETLRFEEFWDNIPDYGILSHTWDEEEVLFQELQAYHNGDDSIEKHSGFEKIRQTARIAKGYGLVYIWVDTCCINKSSSVELQEAYNSMFTWYKDSKLCIVYLCDVRSDIQGDFLGARWFKRGWTLPELIAPRKVFFYDCDWAFSFSKAQRLYEISSITGIDPFVLAGGDLGKIPVARRMLWASGRWTRRPEDTAYCLLGLFDVNMSIIYGEGAEKAFLRLQEQIISTTYDVSLFAWQDKVNWRECGWVFNPNNPTVPAGRSFRKFLFAKSPKDFAYVGSLFPRLDADFRGASTASEGSGDQRGLSERGDEHVDLSHGANASGEFEHMLADARRRVRERMTTYVESDCSDSSRPASPSSSHWETMSITSTTSTLVETPEDEPANRNLLHAISLLQEDQDVSPLLERAMSELGSEKFQRILARLLWLMAAELASEAKSKDENSVGSFLRRHRLLIASAITSGLAQSNEPESKTQTESHGEEKHTRKDNQGLHNDGDNVEDEHIVPAEVDDKEEGEAVEADQEEPELDFLPFDKFILSSQAHQQLVARLKDLAYPTFRSRAWNLSYRVLKSEAAKHWPPEYKDCMKSAMALVISEHIFSRPEALYVEDDYHLSRIEKCQLWMESMTGQAWNWWPLQPPRPLQQVEEARLGWTCTCGDVRWVAVPIEFAHRMAELVKKYPIRKFKPDTPTTPTAKPAATIPTGGTSAPAATSGQDAVQGKGKGIGKTGQVHMMSSTAPMASPAYSPVSEQQPSIPQARFLFVVGKFGRYRLDELPSLHLDTEQFAHHLRSTYLNRKGFWKRGFSMFGFSHCDFGKFQRYRRNGYSHQGYGLPDRAKKEYYYTPTSWQPPISPEEFKHLYQHVASKSDGLLKRTLKSWLPSHMGSLPTAHQLPSPDDEDYDGEIPTDTVDRIPQRYWNINKTVNMREDFWGILIQERRSAVMTALYTLLTISPFLTFCILYLLGIVQGDVQNATTPLAISLTAFSLLLGFIIKQ